MALPFQCEQSEVVVDIEVALVLPQYGHDVQTQGGDVGAGHRLVLAAQLVLHVRQLLQHLG